MQEGKGGIVEASTLFAIAIVLLIITVLLYLLFPSESRNPNNSSALSLSGLDPSDTIGKGVQKRRNASESGRQLRLRLIQAGFYGRNATLWLTITKIVSLVVPLALAILFTRLTDISFRWTLTVGFATAIASLIGPSFVLDHFKRRRQKCITRSIPDALDVLSICLEAGMSLPSALLKVSQELSSAHPELALELAIVNRETLLGRGVGEAMRAFADRFDIEELRSLSSVITQAEKYGSSLLEAMEVFATTMRQKRMNAAESHAQQAVAKILIPTAFCILPALFLVTLGPAVILIIRGLPKA